MSRPSSLRAYLPKALVLAALGLLAATGIAEAAPAQGDPACKTGEFCLWPEGKFSGDAQRFDLRTR